MILTVNIPPDWENNSIKEVFKEIVASYNIYGGMTLSETSPNEFQGVCGKNKRSIFPSPARIQYKATFKIESGSNGSKLIIDYEEGKIMKIGKLGKSYIKIYFDHLHKALKEVLEKTYSSFNQHPQRTEKPMTTNTKACNNCGKQIPIDTKFCTYCGATQIQVETPITANTKACINCGKQIPIDTKFCTHCGAAQTPHIME